jgi:hypothetical protein
MQTIDIYVRESSGEWAEVRAYVRSHFVPFVLAYYVDEFDKKAFTIRHHWSGLSLDNWAKMYARIVGIDDTKHTYNDALMTECFQSLQMYFIDNPTDTFDDTWFQQWLFLVAYSAKGIPNNAEWAKGVFV